MAEKRKNSSQKHRIMAKSSILFWEKGYAETSMRDIAEACGFRPANIYNFFKNKESILFEILDRELEEIIAPLRPLEHDDSADPVEQIRLFVNNHVRYTLGSGRSSKLLFDTGLGSLSPANRKKIISLRDEYDRICMAIIKRGKKRGLFRDIDEHMAVFSIASMIARSRIWYSPRGKFSPESIAEFIHDFILNGLIKR